MPTRDKDAMNDNPPPPPQKKKKKKNCVPFNMDTLRNIWRRMF